MKGENAIVRRNRITVSGRGRKAMVFGHGFGLDQTCWRHILPTFEPDHRIVTFDYVGSGGSDRSAYDRTRYATLDGYAQDLLDVLRVQEITRCVFVAASISGMIGVLASLLEPSRFDAMVMIGSSPRYLDDPPDYRGGFREEDVVGLIDMMNDNFIGWAHVMASAAIKDPEIARELEHGICAIDPQIARDFASMAFRSDFRSLLPRCSAPALIVQCTHDDIVPLSAARYLAEHLPNARLELMQASGHCPQLTHPHELSQLIRGFVREQESRP